jgi:hypothetical protein
MKMITLKYFGISLFNSQLRLMLLSVFILISNSLLSQNINFINGKITDNKSGNPISFATIRLKSEQGVLGVISNQDGDFQIPLKYKTTVDTIMISCIGFITKKLPMNQLKENQLNLIILQESVLQLSDVIVKAKREEKLNAYKIVKAAIENIPYNYPSSAYSYIAYYRDYQIRKNQYVNLNEAIVEIVDNGFNSNDQLTTSIGLYGYKKNQGFDRDTTIEIPYDNADGNKFIPGALLFPFGGNELTILRIHDAIRNNKIFSYSFIDRFSNDFINNHFLKLDQTIMLNNILLYQISFRSRSTISGSNYFSNGTLYIEQGDFAIHKLEYSLFRRERQDSKLLYNIRLEYSRSNSLMYLNFISFNNFFERRNPLDFKVLDIVLDRYINAFIVTFSNKPEIQSVYNKRNYDLEFDNIKLEIDRIEIPLRKENQVYLYLRQTLPPTDNSLKLAERLKASIRGVIDTQGRKLNQATYIPVNQFRELFVQTLTLRTQQLSDSMKVNKNLPLSQGKISNGADTDIGNYWMNTPLKKD